MIENYLDFNIAKFVKDCFEHEKMLPSLRQQYNDLDGVRGIDPSKDRVQESPSNEAIVNLAMLRISLDAKIKDYEKDIKLLRAAMQSLNDDEREAIEICFSGRNVKSLCEDRHIEERTLYNRRKRALEKLRRAIIGH